MSDTPADAVEEYRKNAIQTMAGFTLLKPEQISDLEKHGDAITFKRGDVIPQFHAVSMEEYLAIVDKYRRISAVNKKVGCFLRGQTATYFTEDGDFNASPAARRPSAENTPFFGITNSAAISEQLGPWFDVLGDVLDVELGDCLRFIEMERGEDYGILRFLPPSVFSGRIASDVVEAILQHYGFPTYCLDVTTNPFVAAWFALHQARRDHQNEITFDPVSSPMNVPVSTPARPQEYAPVPAVLVYWQPLHDNFWPVVDLRANEELRRVAVRPVVQEAYSMPFLVTTMSQPVDAVRVLDQACERQPVAVIKLHFGASDLLRIQPNLTAETVLPLDDPLYLALREAKVPHLAVFHTERTVSPDTIRAIPARSAAQIASMEERKNKPRPGSIGDNPRAVEVLFKAMRLFADAGIHLEGSSVSQQDITLIMKDPKSISEELRAALQQLAEWGDLDIYCRRPEDVND